MCELFCIEMLIFFNYSELEGRKKKYFNVHIAQWQKSAFTKSVNEPLFMGTGGSLTYLSATCRALSNAAV